MSYDIIYERQFVKLPDNRVVPLVLSGCNNVYEVCSYRNGRTYERRTREWTILFGLNQIARTPDELMQLTMDCVPTSSNQHFKYQSKWVDDASFIRFVKNGIKQAKTLEELKSLSDAPDRIYLHCQMFVCMDDGTKRREIHRIAMSTGELVSFIDEFESRRKKLTTGEKYVDAVVFFAEDTAIPLPKTRFDKRNALESKRRSIIDSGECYVLMNNCGWYFTRLTKYRIKGSYYLNTAKLFATAEEAADYLKRKSGRLGATGLRWTVIKINNNAKQTM